MRHRSGSTIGSTYTGINESSRKITDHNEAVDRSPAHAHAASFIVRDAV